MASDKTILYYSANTENQEFEKLIMDDLRKKAGDIPIISITRKPVDLGTNICIGETPVCYTNEWRQMLIGLKAAKTKFCMTAEADCLYPDDYFNFTPKVDDVMHYYENLWMVWRRHNGFWEKTGHCEGAEICGREYWISRIEPVLGEGWEPRSREWESKIVREFFPVEETFTGAPIISFKTGDGVSSRTTFKNKKIMEIPYWGRIEPLKAKYFKPYDKIHS
jgi:hypothetical protein